MLVEDEDFVERILFGTVFYMKNANYTGAKEFNKAFILNN